MICVILWTNVVLAEMARVHTRDTAENYPHVGRSAMSATASPIFETCGTWNYISNIINRTLTTFSKGNYIFETESAKANSP